ncbi:hypothetical protein ACT4UT_25170, partial [Bacillus sp. B-TM1]
KNCNPTWNGNLLLIFISYSSYYFLYFPKPKAPTETISDEERQLLLSDVNTTLKDFEKYKK